MKRTGLVYSLWVALPLAVGGLSAWASADGIRDFSILVQQPPLSPPPDAFPLVWTVLYALMGAGAANVFLQPPSSRRGRALNLFFVQLILNFFWSPIFFRLRAYGLAFFWLVLLSCAVLAMVLAFRQVSAKAARWQVPYCLWLAAALYLSFGVWRLNG